MNQLTRNLNVILFWTAITLWMAGMVLAVPVVSQILEY